MLEQTLPNLVRSADQVVVLDTGSTDETVLVAEKLGAEVHRFDWINDFSAARNESLRYATGDWVLWIDADEYLKEEDLASLKETLAHSKANDHSLTLYESKVGTCETKNGWQRTKAFRNGHGYHFIRPINEQLVDKAGKVASGNLLDIPIYHWGQNLGEDQMKTKWSRYVGLYAKALAGNEADPHLHFLLATNLKKLGRTTEAFNHYNRAYELAAKDEIGRKALEQIAQALLRAKKLPEAARAAQTLLELEPKNIPARNVFASIYLVSGKLDEAIKTLEEALTIKLEEHGVENQYQSKAMPNFLLSKAYGLKGDREKAEACLKEYRRLMGN